MIIKKKNKETKVRSVKHYLDTMKQLLVNKQEIEARMVVEKKKLKDVKESITRYNYWFVNEYKGKK